MRSFSAYELVNRGIEPKMKFELIFEPKFLGPDVTAYLIDLIDNHAALSRLETGAADYRKASTAFLAKLHDPVVANVERGIAWLLGLAGSHCEGLQGQLYTEGQYYKKHWDAFHPGTLEFNRYVPLHGQRTWTAMIYLNEPELGGETAFPALGVSIKPTARMMVYWYNLDRDNKPHPLAVHAALPVERGKKYVVTAWFRSDVVGRTRAAQNSRLLREAEEFALKAKIAKKLINSPDGT
jgi:prolyl 4-hydroxylase